MKRALMYLFRLQKKEARRHKGDFKFRVRTVGSAAEILDDLIKNCNYKISEDEIERYKQAVAQK